MTGYEALILFVSIHYPMTSNCKENDLAAFS